MGVWIMKDREVKRHWKGIYRIEFPKEENSDNEGKTNERNNIVNFPELQNILQIKQDNQVPIRIDIHY